MSNQTTEATRSRLPSVSVGRDPAGGHPVMGEDASTPTGSRSPKNPCGTRAAAERHRRNGEPICDPCKEAERTYYRERARMAYKLPTYRARENARTRERLRRYRADPERRDRINQQKRLRAAALRQREREDRLTAVDPIVVERLVAGIDVTANRAEKYAAYAALRDRGMAHSAALEQVRASSAMRRPFAASYSTPEAERRSA